MKPAKPVTFLLLLLVFVTVQGIRSNREFVSAAPSIIHDMRDEDGRSPSSRVHERRHVRPNHHCRSSFCSGRRDYSMPHKRTADRGMPSLHADYYGPRIHDPRHH
ncbi:unnamed protein product [Victoria cruziana]